MASCPHQYTSGPQTPLATQHASIQLPDPRILAQAHTNSRAWKSNATHVRALVLSLGLSNLLLTISFLSPHRFVPPPLPPSLKFIRRYRLCGHTPHAWPPYLSHSTKTQCTGQGWQSHSRRWSQAGGRESTLQKEKNRDLN